jgi:hypothetical protein
MAARVIGCSDFARWLLLGARMYRLFAFFGCLALVLSLGLGSAAHASESMGYVEISAAGLVAHSVGDSDELPADADKAYPHHHADCHGHQLGVPATSEAVVTINAVGVQPFPWIDRRRARGIIDPALRPPQA